MLGLLRLAPMPRPAIEAGLRAAAAALGHENVFNVSVLAHDGLIHVAYRALPRGEAKPFHAFYAVADPAAPSKWTITSLTDFAARSGVAPAADPKLMRLGSELFVTVNTGYSPVQNEIYLMRVSPELTAPQKCVLVSGRQKVEKNWAFFLRPGGRLAAIYQLSPYTELNLVRGELGGAGDLEFERSSAGSGLHADRLTIGSAVLVQGHRMLLIAHEKIHVIRKRAYVGRVVEITGSGTPTPAVRVSRRRLIHSYRALLPPRRRHNPNLISATYFAGVTPSEGGLLLGYGINDMDFSMVTVTEEQLWT